MLSPKQPKLSRRRERRLRPGRPAANLHFPVHVASKHSQREPHLLVLTLALPPTPPHSVFTRSMRAPRFSLLRNPLRLSLLRSLNAVVCHSSPQCPPHGEMITMRLSPLLAGPVPYADAHFTRGTWGPPGTWLQLPSSWVRGCAASLCGPSSLPSPHLHAPQVKKLHPKQQPSLTNRHDLYQVSVRQGAAEEASRIK